MIVTLPNRAPVTNPANPTPRPCGMNGLACASSSCSNCPSARPASTGMGAFYETWPAPFNNPMILIAAAVVVFLVFGGGLKLFSGGKSSGRRNAKLRLIRAQAEEKRAALLAS